MSMKQKLMLTLVLLAAIPMLISVVASTWVAGDIAGGLLVEQAREKLISVRELKKAHIEDFYLSLRRNITTFAKSGNVKNAASRLGAEFYSFNAGIGGTDLEEKRNSLRNFYQTQFGEKYKFLNLGKTIDGASLISNLSDNRITMQFHFISGNPNPLGSKHLLDQTELDTSYDSEHAVYHPLFRNVLEEFGYSDILIAHPTSGDIIYSVFKKTDFATSLINGPYTDSGIGEAFRAATAATDPDFIHITDFSKYMPSYSTPAAFMSAPIFGEPNFMGKSGKIGVVIFQIPDDIINKIMTNEQGWESAGLGKSGETFLVGNDKLMRSSSRFLLEAPERYAEHMSTVGLDRQVIDEILVKNTSVAMQPVDTVSSEKVRSGETGFDIFPGYRGIPVLSAYSKLDIKGLEWYIFSAIDKAEAFAPAAILSRNLLLTSGAGAAVMLVIAILLGWRFSTRLTAPIIRLEQEIAEIEANSDLTKRLLCNTGDVTGGIVDSLNKMFDKLRDIVNMVATNSMTMESAANNVNNASSSTAKSISEQSTETSRMATSIQKITSTVVEVANNSDQANDAAKDANEQAIQGNKIVVAASSSIHDLAQGIQKTSEVITRLAIDSENIGGVLDVIRSIAEQTNLLALNAAIEAARAGEHGRGFAVVADEVRTLASRTQESTAEIQTMIERLQSGTHNAVDAMKNGQQQAKVSVSQASEASEALQKITNSMADITKMNGNIALASSQQRSVAEEVEDSIQLMAFISKTTTESSLKTEQASNELSELSQNLKGAVNRFRFN